MLLTLNPPQAIMKARRRGMPPRLQTRHPRRVIPPLKQGFMHQTPPAMPRMQALKPAPFPTQVLKRKNTHRTHPMLNPPQAIMKVKRRGMHRTLLTRLPRQAIPPVKRRDMPRMLLTLNPPLLIMKVRRRGMHRMPVTRQVPLPITKAKRAITPRTRRATPRTQAGMQHSHTFEPRQPINPKKPLRIQQVRHRAMHPMLPIRQVLLPITKVKRKAMHPRLLIRQVPLQTQPLKRAFTHQMRGVTRQTPPSMQIPAPLHPNWATC